MIKRKRAWVDEMAMNVAREMGLQETSTVQAFLRQCRGHDRSRSGNVSQLPGTMVASIVLSAFQIVGLESDRQSESHMI